LIESLLVKILRVYLDTSVIGGCFDPEFSAWSNRLMDDFENGRFIPVVATELGVAPANVRQEFEGLLRLKPEFLEITEEALTLAGVYAGHGALPPRFRNDLLHIAMATVANVDVLVSWNFKHIVRLEKIRIFNAVNLELGYKALQIHSPREVATDE
jgi:hypothetical protein